MKIPFTIFSVWAGIYNITVQNHITQQEVFVELLKYRTSAQHSNRRLRMLEKVYLDQQLNR